ncbi:MAG: YceI family protein [Flavobacteriaceae bacterium]|nr:YceI family protein [Flavobacteriaceae bacterium]
MFRILFILFSTQLFSQGSVEIKGFTNINSFKCISKKVHLQKHNAPSDLPIKEIIVKINDFECDSKKMTQEFKEMMNADKNPDIKITVNSHNSTSNKQINTVSDVNMNGKTKRYNMPVVLNNNHYQITQWFNIHHFNLKPPRILGGLVKIKDEVQVTVNINK